jgi:hypothetical protein
MVTFSRVALPLLAADTFASATACSSPSAEYETYEQNLKMLNMEDEQQDEDAVESFAQGNCSSLVDGNLPGFMIEDKGGLARPAAAIDAYCHQALDPMLQSVARMQPDYATYAHSVRNPLRADNLDS